MAPVTLPVPVLRSRVGDRFAVSEFSTSLFMSVNMVGAALAAPLAGALADLESSWDEVRGSLPGRAKSRFSGGRFISGGADGVVFGLPNAIHRDRCQECVADVEAALAQRFGGPVSVSCKTFSKIVTDRRQSTAGLVWPALMM